MTFSSSREPITTLLVDLDDTLYDSKAMSEQVAENIRKYMVQKLGIATSVCEEMCRELYLNYGTTLAGLVVCSCCMKRYQYCTGFYINT